MRYHVTCPYFDVRNQAMSFCAFTADTFDDKETLQNALRKIVTESLKTGTYFAFDLHGTLNPFNHVDAQGKYLEPTYIETEEQHAARLDRAMTSPSVALQPVC